MINPSDRIGTFCEKCRQVVCICADIANKWVSSSLLEGLHYKNIMTSSIFESKPNQILDEGMNQGEINNFLSLIRNEFGYERIGTFCEKCRQVMCVCVIKQKI